MKMLNSCLEVAVQKAYKVFTDEDLEFDADKSINDNQVVIGPVIAALNEGMIFLDMPIPQGIDFDYSRESGASAQLLAAALRKLNQDSIYILRTGTRNGAGHYHTVYFEPDHGWILYSGSTKIFQLTDVDGLVVETPHIEVRKADEELFLDGEFVGEAEGAVVAIYPEWMEQPENEDGLIVDSKAILGGGQLIVTDRLWGAFGDQHCFDFTELTKERTMGCANFLAQYRMEISADLDGDMVERMEANIADEIAFRGAAVFEEIDSAGGYWQSDSVIERDADVAKTTGMMLHYRCSENEHPDTLKEIIERDPESTIRQDGRGKMPFDFLLGQAVTHNRTFDQIKPSVDLILSDLISKGGDYASQAYDTLCEANIVAFDVVPEGTYFASLEKKVDLAGGDDTDVDEEVDPVQLQKANVLANYDDVLGTLNLKLIDDSMSWFLRATTNDHEVRALQAATSDRKGNHVANYVRTNKAVLSYCYACLPPGTSKQKIEKTTNFLKTYHASLGPFVDGVLQSREQDFVEDEEEDVRSGVDELTTYYKEMFAPLMKKDLGLEKSVLNEALTGLIEKVEELRLSNPGSLDRTLYNLLEETLDDDDITAQLQSLVHVARVSGAIKMPLDDDGLEDDELEEDELEEDVVVVGDRPDAVEALNKALDEYLQGRQKVQREKYFWGGIFGGGISYTRKHAAVEALRAALDFDPKKGEELPDLNVHLPALRDGYLGGILRTFIRGSYWKPEVQDAAKFIVGGTRNQAGIIEDGVEIEHPRVSDFIGALITHNEDVLNAYESQIEDQRKKDRNSL